MELNSNEILEPRDRRSADWFWIHKTVWANSLLTASDKVLYGTMALFANGNSQRLFPSVLKMAKFSVLSERQVRYSLKRLKDLGYISIEKTPGTSSNYTLLDVGGAKFAPLQNSRGGGAKCYPQVVQNSSTNNNKEQELIKKGKNKENPNRGSKNITIAIEKAKQLARDKGVKI